MNIAKILKERDVSLLPKRNEDLEAVHARADITKRLTSMYPAFFNLRYHLTHCGRGSHKFRADNPHEAALLDLLLSRGLIRQIEHEVYDTTVGHAIPYLRHSGWLEEFMFLAAEAGGSDETLLQQKVSWRVGPYEGKNEIDVIARRDTSLFFISCKTAKPEFEEGNSGQRNALSRFLDEADNIADHFGAPLDQVALAVTTDLIDEAQDDLVRYPALFGKAQKLNVHLFTLENMDWQSAVLWMEEKLTLDRSELAND